MRATVPNWRFDVPCPDCGGRAELREGRYGRFYQCERYACGGTVGARLDGQPKPDRASPTLRTVRKRARIALGLMFEARDDLAVAEGARPEFEEIGYPSCCSCGKEWPDVREKRVEGNVQWDIAVVVHGAGLQPTTRFGRRWRWMPEAEFIAKNVGIHLRRRTVDECRRIEVAAKARTEWLIEEAKLAKARRRGNAWDRVYVGSFDEATA